MFRRLAADDIFISYSREDASIYADGLADILVRKGFSVFIDRLGTEATPKIPKSLRRKLQRTSMLVVICSPCAARSAFVGEEVTEFSSAGRSDRIVPIGLDDAVLGAMWYSKVQGIPIETEPIAALQTGEVSDRAVSRIEKAFRYTRSKDRLRHYTWGALGLLGLLTLLGAGAGLYARDQLHAATDADRRADLSLERARSADGRASEAQTGAARSIAEAASAVALANTQQLGAERTRDSAVAQAETAKKAADDQQQVASALRLANEAKANRGTSSEELAQSLRLAMQSVELRSTRPGLEALREGLSLVPRLERARDLSFTEGAVWASASGRAFALRRAGDQLHVWKKAESDTDQKAASLTIRLPSGHTEVALSDDGRLVASSVLKVIRVQDTVSGAACEELFFEDGDEAVIDIAISGKGEYMAALVAQEEIRSLYVWRIARIETGACKWSSTVRRLGDVQWDRPQRVRFSDTAGKALLNLHGYQDHAGTYYAYMRSFEIAANEKNKEAEALRIVESSIRRTNLGIGIAESPAGNLIALANEAAATAWILTRNLSGGYDEAVRMPLQGKLLGAAFHGTRSLTLYVKNGAGAVQRQEWSYKGVGEPIRLSFDEPLVELSGLPNGRLVTVHRSFDDKVKRRIWNVASGVETVPLAEDAASVSVPASKAIASEPRAKALARSADGELIALGSDSGIVRVNRASSQEPVAVLRHDDPVSAVIFVQGQRFLAVATSPLSPDTRSGEASAVHLWRLDPRDLVLEVCAQVSAVCRPAAAAAPGRLDSRGGK